MGDKWTLSIVYKNEKIYKNKTNQIPDNVQEKCYIIKWVIWHTRKQIIMFSCNMLKWVVTLVFYELYQWLSLLRLQIMIMRKFENMILIPRNNT